MPKHTHPRFINDLDYVMAWQAAADRFTAARPIIDPPPAHLLRRYGRPRCASCWDTGLCYECLGYSQFCAIDCDDGTCTCAAGAARRAYYIQSIGVERRQ